MSTPYVAYSYADGSANTLRPTKITYPNGREVDYDYGTADSPDDLFSRVFQIQEDTDVLAKYDYLGATNIFRCDYAEPQVRWDLSPTGDTFTGLDSLDRVVDNLWRNYGASTDADRIKYTYDRASNRTSRENTVAPSGNDELYGYDGVNRLRNLGRGDLTVAKDRVTAPTFAERWNLDATGNWSGYGRSDYLEPDDSVEQTRTADTVNEITGIANSLGAAWEQPAYDPTGNMTAMQQPNNPSDAFRATYDAWNRLVLLEDDATAVAAYAYDPLFRRVTVDDGATVRHAYFSQQWQTLEERLDSSTDAERQFVWGLRYIDDLILRDRTTSGPLDERLYALQDANWNVDAIVDDDGAVQERYRYAAYGQPTFLQPDFTPREPNQSDYQWETLYCGYRYDAETGLYYVRNRYLQFELGSWITRDEIDNSLSLSLYNYCYTTPHANTDPTGLVPTGKYLRPNRVFPIAIGEFIYQLSGFDNRDYIQDFNVKVHFQCTGCDAFAESYISGADIIQAQNIRPVFHDLHGVDVEFMCNGLFAFKGKDFSCCKEGNWHASMSYAFHEAALPPIPPNIRVQNQSRFAEETNSFGDCQGVVSSAHSPPSYSPLRAVAGFAVGKKVLSLQHTASGTFTRTQQRCALLLKAKSPPTDYGP